MASKKKARATDEEPIAPEVRPEAEPDEASAFEQPTAPSPPTFPFDAAERADLFSRLVKALVAGQHLEVGRVGDVEPKAAGVAHTIVGGGPYIAVFFPHGGSRDRYARGASPEAAIDAALGRIGN